MAIEYRKVEFAEFTGGRNVDFRMLIPKMLVHSKQIVGHDVGKAMQPGRGIRVAVIGRTP